MVGRNYPILVAVIEVDEKQVAVGESQLSVQRKEKAQDAVMTSLLSFVCLTWIRR